MDRTLFFETLLSELFGEYLRIFTTIKTVFLFLKRKKWSLLENLCICSVTFYINRWFDFFPWKKKMYAEKKEC